MIENKFNVGDNVWFLYHHKARQGVVSEPMKGGYMVIKFGENNQYTDFIMTHHVFETKKELADYVFGS